MGVIMPIKPCLTISFFSHILILALPHTKENQPSPVGPLEGAFYLEPPDSHLCLLQILTQLYNSAANITPGLILLNDLKCAYLNVCCLKVESHKEIEKNSIQEHKELEQQ